MIHKLLFISLLVFLPLFFYSCNESSSADIDKFEIAQNSYQVGENMNRYIHIISGNSDYTVTIENEELVEATYHPDSFDYGGFTIKGLQKGKTMITVKDNVNGQEENLAITVTDGYLLLSTGDPLIEIVSDNPASDDEIKELIRSEYPFKEGDQLVFINREGENFYIFEDYDSAETGDYTEMGEYSMSVIEQHSAQITLSLNSWQHIFNLYFDGNSEEFIKNLFGENVLQKSIYTTETNRTSPVEPYVIMTREVTDLYQADYPDLIRAEITIPTSPIHPEYLDLPEEFVY